MSYFLPLLHVTLKFMLAYSMLKLPDGVWKQQNRLHGRARNTPLQSEMITFVINWAIRLVLVTKHGLN